MKNRLRYFIATIILMMVSILSSKAVVVFDADADNVNGKSSITKDGITISTTNGSVWDYNTFRGELSITSSDKYIVMVGLKLPDKKTIDEYGASNTYRYNHSSSPSRHNAAQNRNDTSDSWEDWSYTKTFDDFYEQDFIGYRVWKGVSSELICPDVSRSIYKIFVYLAGDELPQKSPFAMYYSWERPYFGPEHSTIKLTLCFGYLDFLPEGYEYNEESVGIDDRSIHVKQYPFNIDGSNQDWDGVSFDQIIFDDSFSDYKPKSTSKWFKGVSFGEISLQNLDLSEVQDMSYMFENCSMIGNYQNRKFDMSGMSFSNHPKVTGMFSGSNINYIKVQNNKRGRYI